MKPAQGLDAAVAAFYGFQTVAILDHHPTPDNPMTRELRRGRSCALEPCGPLSPAPIEVVASGSTFDMLEYFRIDEITALRDALDAWIQSRAN